jgi:hypothetical protein
MVRATGGPVTNNLPTSHGDGEERAAPDVRIVRPRIARVIDERIAVAFWVFVFGVFSSFLGALAAIALQVDVTALEAGFIGAFLGSAPIWALPLVVRFAVGSQTRLAERDHPAFRIATVSWGVLVIAERRFVGWPHAPSHSHGLALAGLVAGILAAWYLPHLPHGLRVWARQLHPFPEVRDT